MAGGLEVKKRQKQQRVDKVLLFLYFVGVSHCDKCN